ncbi:MFS general substrate transporter [Calocera cornea HHB12733]|uniref:MFS general substrate transporter n=1 Tax=Calocera cornea HHB12733 TaxID=1353952 RepID=A0A165DGV7_9BASI|nr:MFS general substrate transporter [Calocera cornea HHB12733]
MPAFKQWMHSRPLGLNWRSGIPYVTLVVALGIAVDGLVYSLPVAVIPFQLGKLGYTELSSKTGWLLFAYAAGVVVCTAPIAYVSEKYDARRLPLVFALVALQGSLIMFMLAPNYALMLLARALQGAASSIVWTVGIALVCDVVPTHRLGQQLGLAVTGLSLGSVAGPPLGGVLYQRFGFYAPFILGIALAVIDLAARLVVIEPKVAKRWHELHAEDRESRQVVRDHVELSGGPSTCGETTTALAQQTPSSARSQPPVASFRPILCMLSSTLALTACFNTFIYGLIFGALDATLPLRLWDEFAFTSQMVGIIYIAAIVPTAFSGLITGWICDKKGSKWVTVFFELAAMPWFALLTLPRSLALFIACLALGCFFASGIVSPVMADFAAVARNMEGIGYAHVYGAFNIAFSIAVGIGPVIGSQMYDHLGNGWTAVCVFCLASIAAGVGPTFFFSGNASKKDHGTTNTLEDAARPPE